VTVPPNQYFVMGDNRGQLAGQPYGFLRARTQRAGAGDLLSYEAERGGLRKDGAGAMLKGLASVFVHFFTRTGWDRMLHQIR